MMLSILDVKRKLPKAFIEELYSNYTPLTVDKILSGMTGKRNTTIRVNTLKSDVQEIMKILKENAIKFDRVNWYTDALIIKNATEKQIEALEIYEKGFIYLQSLSSMVPPLVLEPKRGEKILELTAAPGSKTTQIAALMQNEGYILATYQSLKPGGELVYSTCTLNKIENEEILEWAISEMPLKLQKIDLKIKDAIKADSNIEEIKNAIRILPLKETEGFFIAKLKK